ncbi:MAG: M1 family aminopeptidase [candidate division KSB1 bacterium]|nr:M1 family aminopeptidase [candidate division KSB1 bacterium]
MSRRAVWRSLVVGVGAPCLMAAGLVLQPYDSGGPLLPEQATYDVRFYDLDLRIDPVQRTLRGSVTVEAVLITPCDSLLLNLDPLLKVDSVWVASEAGGFERSGFRQRGPYLSVSLMGQGRSGASVRTRVFYGGRPRVAPNPPWDGGLVWSRTPSGAPWIGVACQLEGADVWWPCKDHPSDEPDSVALHFTVPADLVCVANGRFLGTTENADHTRTYHWFVSTPINNYGISFYAAPYVQLEAPYVSLAGDTIPTFFWVLPEHVAQGQTFLSRIHQDLRFLESVAGPYPFRRDKYGVAEAPYLGMEHQTIIAYGNRFRTNSYGFDELHFHELAHEWYGNCVTAADWKDFWIHESFATYLEALYAESLGGRQAYKNYLAGFRGSIQNHVPLAPRESKSTREMYSLDIYYKGAWVLHTLRFLLGDGEFRTFLRRVVYPDSSLEKVTDGAQCRFATTEDIVQLAESIAGEDLDWFFEVYLRQPRLPQLVVERSAVSIRLRWQVPNDLPFPMPVEVQAGRRIIRVDMSPGSATLRVNAGDEVQIDPEGWILMEKPLFTGVEELAADVPARVELGPNWPNPFNDWTLLEFELPRDELVRIEVFDSRGRVVARVCEGRFSAGRHSVRLDARELATGTYVCRLQAGSDVRYRKILLLR